MKQSMLPGLLGMILIIVAMIFVGVEQQRSFFFVGALGMGLTALLERHALFIGLQFVVISGTLAAFLPLTDAIKGLVPVMFSLPILGLLIVRKELSTKRSYFGSLALLTLSVGYATQVHLGFFVGGILICIYSAMELRAGFKPATLWLLLNTAFTAVAAVKLLH